MKKISIFDNYQDLSDYVPDNRPIIICQDTDNFIIGGTCTFTFEFKLDENDIKDIQFIYKEGISTLYIKEKNELDLEQKDDILFVSSTLTSEETKNVNPLRNLFIQVKFTLNDDTIVYSNDVKLKIVETLDN